MSAQIIPFDPSAARRIAPDAQAAWDAYHAAAMDVLALMQDPTVSSDRRRDANLRAIRLHRTFLAAAEAM